MSHPSFEDLWRQLNELDESPQIEAKRGSDIGHSILETISAFSNEPGLGGGYLLLGIKEDDATLPGMRGYTVCGVEDTERLQQSLVSACNGLFNERLRPEMKVELFRGTRVLRVFIPEAPASSKPIFIKKDGLPNGAKRRIGSSDVSCSPDDLAVLFGGRGFKPYDSEIVFDSQLSDLDSDVVAAYRRLRTTINADASELHDSDTDLLISLGCVSNDGQTLRPTVAGLLLFGSRAALRRLMPFHRVDYVVAPGRTWGDGLDQSLTAIEFREALITLLPRLERVVSGDLPRTSFMPTDGVAAKSSSILPERVLREAIINAAMHRDYRITSPTQIIRYTNRIEIQNPGYSLKALEKFDKPGSVPRNPSIAAVLHEINFAETKGSGIRRMVRLMEQANLTKPFFNSDRPDETFTISLFTHNLMSEEDLEWISRFADFSLSGEDVKALVLVRETGFLSNQNLRFETGLDTLTASKKLKRLRDLGLIISEGKGSATFYRPGPLMISSLINDPGPKTGASGVSEPIPTQLMQRIAALGRRAGKARIMEQLIFDLVSWQPMGMEEISSRLGRGPEKILKSYIRPMLRAGLLRPSVVAPGQDEAKYEPGQLVWEPVDRSRPDTK